MSLNIFRNYEPASQRGVLGDPGGGNPWINFELSIPSSERERLQTHVLLCASSNQYLAGIKKGRHGYDMVLPIIETPEFRGHLREVAEIIHPRLKDEFINMQERQIEFVLAGLEESTIVGINTRYGLPTLTVDEVEAIRSCMTSYVKLDDKVQNNDHHIPPGAWREDAYKEFIDPITTEILREPVIASDGHTYSKSTLIQLFKTTGISPMTREPLIPIGKFTYGRSSFEVNNQEIGIPNIKVKQLLEKFVDGKLKVSQQKYLKYKEKYLELKRQTKK